MTVVSCEQCLCHQGKDYEMTANQTMLKTSGVCVIKRQIITTMQYVYAIRMTLQITITLLVTSFWDPEKKKKVLWILYFSMRNNWKIKNLKNYSFFICYAMSFVDDIRPQSKKKKKTWIGKKKKNQQYIFRFQDFFLYQDLCKDDSQLCYKRCNRMIWYIILLCVICV